MLVVGEWGQSNKNEFPRRKRKKEEEERGFKKVERNRGVQTRIPLEW